jgi:hypothetical protein
MLFALLGATGMRIGQALGIEINRHISGDFSTLYVRQKVWHGSVQPFLKAESGDRDIDLHSSIATMLKSFVGNRTAGFLFCSKNSRPLLLTNVITLVGSIAELERSLIVERIEAGMRRARMEGQKLGRAPLNIDHDALVRDRLAGMSLTSVAKKYGVSRASVVRFVREAQRRQTVAAA